MFTLEQCPVMIYGECAVAADAAPQEVDLILYGLGPNGDGIQEIPQLRTAYPQLPVLVLAPGDVNLAQEAVRSGAIGYLPKTASFSELLLAIQSVVKGDGYVHPSVAAAALNKLSSKASTPRLSEREKAILSELTNGQNNAQIADKLLISRSTVKQALSKLYSRYRAVDRAHLVALTLQGQTTRGIHPGRPYLYDLALAPV